MTEHLNDLIFTAKQLVNIDKQTLFLLGYSFYIYILMDGTTKQRRRYRYS